MIEGFSDLISVFREELELSSLELLIKPEWSSEHPDSRTRLRGAVAGELDKQKLLTAVEREVLLRLEIVPKPSRASVSISHTAHLGGFAWSPLPGPAIGFDIEEAARVTAHIVERVSKPQELLKAPSPAHLWSAKEAAFKGLRGPHQPKVLSSIEIEGWRSVGSRKNLSLWSWSFHNASLAKGLTVELSGTLFSIFCIEADPTST